MIHAARLIADVHTVRWRGGDRVMVKPTMGQVCAACEGRGWVLVTPSGVVLSKEEGFQAPWEVCLECGGRGQGSEEDTQCECESSVAQAR